MSSQSDGFDAIESSISALSNEHSSVANTQDERIGNGTRLHSSIDDHTVENVGPGSATPLTDFRSATPDYSGSTANLIAKHSGSYPASENPSCLPSRNITPELTRVLDGKGDVLASTQVTKQKLSLPSDSQTIEMVTMSEEVAVTEEVAVSNTESKQQPKPDVCIYSWMI